MPKIALKHVVSRTKSMLPFTFLGEGEGCFSIYFFLTGLQHYCYFLPELAREVLQGGLEMTERRRSSFVIGRRAVIMKSIEEAREGKSRKGWNKSSLRDSCCGW